MSAKTVPDHCDSAIIFECLPADCILVESVIIISDSWISFANSPSPSGGGERGGGTAAAQSRDTKLKRPASIINKQKPTDMLAKPMWCYPSILRFGSWVVRLFLGADYVGEPHLARPAVSVYCWSIWGNWGNCIPSDAQMIVGTETVSQKLQLHRCSGVILLPTSSHEFKFEPVMNFRLVVYATNWGLIESLMRFERVEWSGDKSGRAGAPSWLQVRGSRADIVAGRGNRWRERRCRRLERWRQWRRLGRRLGWRQRRCQRRPRGIAGIVGKQN